MRAAVALLLTLTTTLAGCFPHEPHKRTIAKGVEGGSLIAGIALAAFSNTGADCDANNTMVGSMDQDCRSRAKWADTLGVTLILAGLLGFVATVSTAEDEDQTKPVTTIVPDTTPKPTDTKTAPATNTTNKQATEPTPGAGSADGAGSAATQPPSP